MTKTTWNWADGGNECMYTSTEQVDYEGGYGGKRGHRNLSTVSDSCISNLYKSYFI